MSGCNLLDVVDQMLAVLPDDDIGKRKGIFYVLRTVKEEAPKSPIETEPYWWGRLADGMHYTWQREKFGNADEAEKALIRIFKGNPKSHTVHIYAPDQKDATVECYCGKDEHKLGDPIVLAASV